MRADGEIERRGEEESGVVAGLQITGSHFAPVLGPGLGNVGSRKRPLTADSHAGQKAEDCKLPDILR